jgi:hypothetical protein
MVDVRARHDGYHAGAIAEAAMKPPRLTKRQCEEIRRACEAEAKFLARAPGGFGAALAAYELALVRLAREMMTFSPEQLPRWPR